MALKFDVNKALENKVVRNFTLIVVGTVVFAGLVVCVALSFNGKHNKLPGGIETAIPNDTVTIYDTVPRR